MKNKIIFLVCAVFLTVACEKEQHTGKESRVSVTVYDENGKVMPGVPVKMYVFSGIYRFSDGPYTVVIRTAAFLYDKRQEALRLSGEPCFAGQREQGDTLRVGGCAGSRRRSG